MPLAAELAQDMQTTRFWKRFALAASAFVGGVATLITTLSLFPSLNHWVSYVTGGWSLALYLVAGLGVGVFRAWPRPIECTYSAPNTTIKVVEADLFDQHDASIVVGIPDTFDTDSTTDIIDGNSLLGQLIAERYGNNPKRLDDLIDPILASLSGESVSKPGKTRRYAVGTAISVAMGSFKLHLSAYTSMNEKNNARGDIATVSKSLFMLWDEVRSSGNHRPVAITAWGGGLSRMSGTFPLQDAVRLIIVSFFLASREAKVADELRIVILPSAYKQLDRLELQAFLKSLKAS